MKRPRWTMGFIDELQVKRAQLTARIRGHFDGKDEYFAKHLVESSKKIDSMVSEQKELTKSISDKEQEILHMRNQLTTVI